MCAHQHTRDYQQHAATNFVAWHAGKTQMFPKQYTPAAQAAGSKLLTCFRHRRTNKVYLAAAQEPLHLCCTCSGSHTAPARSTWEPPDSHWTSTKMPPAAHAAVAAAPAASRSRLTRTRRASGLHLLHLQQQLLHQRGRRSSKAAGLALDEHQDAL